MIPILLGILSVSLALVVLQARRELLVARDRELVLRKDLDAARSANDERERLSRAIMEASPVAYLLLGETGRIVFDNRAARELLFDGEELAGQSFLPLLERAPEALQRAVTAEHDELVAIDTEGEREIWSLAKRHFELPNAQGAPEMHTLLLVKHMTTEVNRQEVETWRRIIRVVAHELNNSLAPIASLVHSARVLVRGTPKEASLERVFDTIAERAEHLRVFLDGYASFARMPKPRPRSVEWRPFVDRLVALWPATRVISVPDAPGFFDAPQLEQVIINLLKNADEATPEDAEPDVELEVEQLADRSCRVTVRDRGAGMSEEVLENALLPFYSTKAQGSGLGLAVSREIIEAHGGRMRIRNREGGGAEISFRIPGDTPQGVSQKAKLSLTRA